MEYLANVDGTDHTLTIEARMGYVGTPSGGSAWGVVSWHVTEVDGEEIGTIAAELWADSLDDETVCNAIMGS